MERAVGWNGSVRKNASARVLLGLALVILSGVTLAGATTYYVDANCQRDGNGLALACASTTGGSGPKRTIDAGVALLSSPGDTLRIRGVHPAHDGETADFDGRYFGDQFLVSGKLGTSAAPITIMPYNYSGAGTGERTYIDGTTLPGSGWTQCTNCSSGTCAGVPGTCGDVWYATGSGLASKVIGAQKMDGTPTYRVSSPADLTNSHQGYAGTPPEIDSYSGQTSGTPILVRWGQGAYAPFGASNPKPYVFYDNNGYGFYITNSNYLTVQGFTFRCHRRSAIALTDDSGPTSNVSILDNRFLYHVDVSGNGSDYGVVLYRSVSAIIRNNEFGWTGSEGIHSQANHGASLLTVSGNWFHDSGDPNVLGPQVLGTPAAGILANDTTFGNYAGSVFENNLIINMPSGKGLILENISSNWIVRNNVWKNIARSCIKLDANLGAVSNNQIYNNLFLDCGTNAGATTAPGIEAFVNSGQPLQNNVIYNNTFSSSRDGAIYLNNAGGTISGNLIRNNIMYDSGSRNLVNWSSTDASNIFENNLVYSATLPSGSTLVTWRGSHSSGGPNYTCSQIGSIASSNKCSDPRFKAPVDNDFHLTGTSPAINAGTIASMPVGRSASINNTLAGAHGLPTYADNVPITNSVWDIGASEYLGASAPTATLTLSDPSPTAAGTVTVTLVTSVPIVDVPGLLSFLESDGTSTTISLSGGIPGSLFTGFLVVNTSVADGVGSFSLPINALVDSSGNRGNSIVIGRETTIDKTAPSSPQNLRLGP
jgi:hypothetical protein